MNDIYLKDEFEKWMSKQVKSDGEPYSQRTQKGYIYAITNTCSEIENLNLENSDLFTISSLIF